MAFGVGTSGSSRRRRTRGRSVVRPGLPPTKTAAVAQQFPVVPSASDIAYPTAAPSAGPGTYDINSDPAVAAAHGISAKIRATAQASALARARQAAIEYGDAAGVLDPTTGKPLDQATIDAAANNPFSTTKNLQHSYDVGTRDLEEGLNQANLFYSGYRGQQLGEAARGFQQSKYDAANQFHGLMTDINDQLAQALLQADQYDASAIMGSSGGAYDYGGDSGSPALLPRNDSGFVDTRSLIGPRAPGTVRGALANPYRVSARGYGPRGAISTVNRRGRKVSSYGV